MAVYPCDGPFRCELENQVATIWTHTEEQQHIADTGSKRPTGHVALANLFCDLRRDDAVRVIVLHRGGESFTGNSTEHYEGEHWKSRVNEPSNRWRTSMGIARLLETMAAIEKPIIAQVDGDLIGGGVYLALSSDLIVAREDARFIDHHLGMGQTSPIGPPFGFVPGDGGLSLAPLYFSPPVAKEFLMLAKGFTARELADRGVINYAVSENEIDDVVGDLVRRLLLRPAYPLAWAKRVANRGVIEQLNKTLDAALAWQALGISQLERQGWVDKLTLD